MGLPLSAPAGMRDLLFPHSLARRNLGGRLIDYFSRFGYDLVTTPPFEHAEVIEPGMEHVDRRDLLRFVEPESGEVALLRPDITPQIARIVVTQLADRPPPYRLSYEGSVIRRRRGRARRHRQIAQAGIECVGLEGPRADAEVITLMAGAAELVGLCDYRLELGQVRVGQAVLAGVPEAARPRLAEALSRKDTGAVRTLAREAGLSRAVASQLLALTELYGDVGVLREARRALSGTDAEPAIAELEALTGVLAAEGLRDKLGIDLGELRGMTYYTGVSFTLLSSGPGEPVGGGGRYDHLLSAFGRPAHASGFALDLDNLTWALQNSDRAATPPPPLRIAVGLADVGGEQGATALARSLRQQGSTVAHLGRLENAQCLAFAETWGYDGVALSGPEGLSVIRIGDRQEHLFTEDQIESIGDFLRVASAADARSDGPPADDANKES